MFEPYLARWRLVPDGVLITTPAAELLPVRQSGDPAMLKVSRAGDERRGGALMEWWEGEGAARILARDHAAVLMERALRNSSLADMARAGRDDEACRLLCATAIRLHASRPKPIPELMPLVHWFRELEPAAAKHGGILVRCAETAQSLLAEPRECVALHGDLHHGNVLDFGARGWLAIDPKGLVGERSFDFANIFTNPDLDDPSRPVATEPGRLASRLKIVSEVAKVERHRLLCWILAWTGLSAAWSLGDEDHPQARIVLRVAELAAAELDR